MAKIYEWTYKSQSGQIIADNLKEAKRVIANKFGNAIKVPRGTTIKKVGLTKNKPKQEESVENPVTTERPMTAEVAEDGYVLQKKTSFTGVVLRVNGVAIYAGNDTEVVVPKGATISCVKNV